MFNSEIIKNLNDLELMLYRYIMKNTEKVTYMRIRELADEAHVSTTTILRFCKKFDCNGYSEFKVKLKMYLEGSNIKNVKNDQSTIIDFFRKLNTEELDEKIEAVCDLIESSPNLVFLGSGTSGILCKYAARYFSSMGKFATYIDDPYFPTNYKTYENCVIIILSVSGETHPVINLVNNFKRENCPIVSITNSENCTISKISDLNISYYINQEKIGISDITTKVPVLYIIETIARTLHNRSK
ncbi:MurR/RpiR family transcriptional regulator [uncultured Clostridium sp.]|uniref:MurR/RpiR family transcriptional regulator n=1 Tax=uncultured Clostridium sp. TaxID=59620 RepID=UPI0025CD7785|nr:MurR/RpiR family transcriptional regulator [uncultured Clostridium sp.]